MTIIPAKTEKIITEHIISLEKFIANDGTEFANKQKCLDYEEFLSLNTDIIDLLKPYISFKREKGKNGEYGFNLNRNFCYLYKRVPQKIVNYCIALNEGKHLFRNNFIVRVLDRDAKENMLYYLDGDFWLYNYKDHEIARIKESQTILKMFDYFENKKGE